mmetsp:Transcript_24394/g.34440  ORF Transcript_24394/g.34440 Transcript_24394/m.34440 type:complete len:94 (-) Transcript_24394:5-286(-)
MTSRNCSLLKRRLGQQRMQTLNLPNRHSRQRRPLLTSTQRQKKQEEKGCSRQEKNKKAFELPINAATFEELEPAFHQNTTHSFGANDFCEFSN